MSDPNLKERQLDIQEQKFFLDAEIARARLDLDRKQVGRFSTGTVTMIGAVIAVISSLATTTLGGFFSLQSGEQNNTAQQNLKSKEVLGELQLKRTEVEGQIKVQELVAQAERNRLEIQQKFEIIVQATKGLPPKVASENLKFFVEAGIIEDPEGKIRKLAEAGRAPDLQISDQRNSLGGILGADDAEPLPEFEEGHPVRTLARSVGRLMIYNKKHGLSVCTAFLITIVKVATAKHCVDVEYDRIVFELFPNGIPESIATAKKFSIEISKDSPKFYRETSDKTDGYAVLHLSQPVDRSIQPLDLSSKAGEPNAPLGVIYFRHGTDLSAVWGAVDCRITSWDRDRLHHKCDTGSGTSGSPIIELGSNAVIAVHSRRIETGGLAYRIAD